MFDAEIEQLRAGKTITFRPRGNSMMPLIMSGERCTVEPVWSVSGVLVGDVVLCRVNGRRVFHLVKAADEKRGALIGNNKGGINGWTRTVYGRWLR